MRKLKKKQKKKTDYRIRNDVYRVKTETFDRLYAFGGIVYRLAEMSLSHRSVTTRALSRNLYRKRKKLQNFRVRITLGRYDIRKDVQITLKTISP